MTEESRWLPDEEDMERMRPEVDAIEAAEDKYVYYLLATASAAIFVALQQTSQVGFRESQIILGLAVGCWIASFIAGCVNRRSVITKMEKSFWGTIVTRFFIPILQFRADPEKRTVYDSILKSLERAAQDDEERSQKHHEIARRLRRIQFPTLVMGGSFYLVWHLYEMWLRTS